MFLLCLANVPFAKRSEARSLNDQIGTKAEPLKSTPISIALQLAGNPKTSCCDRGDRPGQQVRKQSG